MHLRRYLTRFSALRRAVEAEGEFVAGHYHSAIPSPDEVSACLCRPRRGGLPEDIDLNRERQLELLGAFTPFFKEIPFAGKSDKVRYDRGQDWFCYTDAIFLYCFIRQFRPPRIIEVGSGFSSAAILDTLDSFPYGKVNLTCIDPDSRRLMSVLRPGDRDRMTIVEKKLQDVDLELFRSLQSGDLLFVDSTHVTKFGSDLQTIFFEIMPYLPAGVFVHFHDVFFPFEYPADWLTQGRYWNEDYFLRSFLSYNETWTIQFFNHYACSELKDHVALDLPVCKNELGGSLYLQRVK